MAKLYFSYAAMNAGKSTLLLQSPTPCAKCAPSVMAASGATPRARAR
jgi:thymidine kinase